MSNVNMNCLIIICSIFYITVLPQFAMLVIIFALTLHSQNVSFSSSSLSSHSDTYHPDPVLHTKHLDNNLAKYGLCTQGKFNVESRALCYLGFKICLNFGDQKYRLCYISSVIVCKCNLLAMVLDF